MKQEAENFIEGLYKQQESNTGRKTDRLKDCSKSNLSRYFVTVLFFQYGKKQLFTRKNLSLFEQGAMSTIIT